MEKICKNCVFEAKCLGACHCGYLHNGTPIFADDGEGWVSNDCSPKKGEGCPYFEEDTIGRQIIALLITRKNWRTYEKIYPPREGNGENYPIIIEMITIGRGKINSRVLREIRKRIRQ